MTGVAMCFAACELRLAHRELRVEGRIRRIEPKVFDVLAYLAVHHGRVVGRAELLASLWTPGAVSDAVLATSMMKARRAIDDRNPDAPLIRTLRRTGYRLVAEVTTKPIARPSAFAQARHKAPHRIAALPFRNLTGRTELLWIEYGLPALLSQAMADQRELTVVPALEVIAFAEGIGRRVPPRTSARFVSNAFDAKYVISAQVRRVDAELEVEFCVFERDRILRVGALRGHDVAELTLSLAKKVCADVLFVGYGPRASDSST